MATAVTTAPASDTSRAVKYRRKSASSRSIAHGDAGRRFAASCTAVPPRYSGGGTVPVRPTGAIGHERHARRHRPRCSCPPGPLRRLWTVPAPALPLRQALRMIRARPVDVLLRVGGTAGAADLVALCGQPALRRSLRNSAVVRIARGRYALPG